MSRVNASTYMWLVYCGRNTIKPQHYKLNYILIMKNYKKLISGSLLTAVIMASPMVSFADNKDGKENGENKFKVEQVKRNKENRENYEKRNNSFSNGFANWFNKRINGTPTVSANINLSPSIEGITAPTVLKVGETGTWTVKASDPKNGSLSYSVDWGDKNILSKSLSLLSEQAFVQTGTFTHTYANKGEYKIIFTVSNDSGLKTVSSTTVHVREVASNTVAPVISNLEITNVKNHKATINWTTDTKSNTMVWISRWRCYFRSRTRSTCG